MSKISLLLKAVDDDENDEVDDEDDIYGAGGGWYIGICGLIFYIGIFSK